MTIFYTIICVLGSVASVIGLLLTKRKEQNRDFINRALYTIILVLCFFAGGSYYKYNKETDKQLDFELRKQKAQIEAKAILASFPSFTNHFEPGKNEGIFFSTLFYLERNKSLWPDTYKTFKENFDQIIDKYNNEPNGYTKNELMETAADKAVMVMKSLAQ